MANKKAIVLGSALLIAGSTLANQTEADLFQSKDLGTEKEVKEAILDKNEVNDQTLILSPLELCCAYGDFNSRTSKKRRRQANRNYRKQVRKEKRNK